MPNSNEIVLGAKLIVNEFGNGFLNLADGRTVYVRKADIFKWWQGSVSADVWNTDGRWYGRIHPQPIVGREFVGQIHHFYGGNTYVVVHERGSMLVIPGVTTLAKHTWVCVIITGDASPYPEARITRVLQNDADEVAEATFCLTELASPEGQTTTITTTNRRDLTHLHTFTIDGPTTQDCDDAFSVQHDPDNNQWRIWVHISDVSAYFNPETTPELFKQILQRGRTTYGQSRSWPMIPTQYAHDTCSILPGKVTLTHSCEFTVKGEDGCVEFVAEYWSQVRSAEKRLYSAAGDLSGLREGAAWLSSQTQELDLTSGQLPHESMTIVKRWMILTNCTMSQRLQRVFRSHEAPSANEVADVVGTTATTTTTTTTATLNEFLQTNTQPVHAWRIKNILKRAVYNEDPLMGHWALGIAPPNTYTHWTSPIRRAADLVCQCYLKGHTFTSAELTDMLQQINGAGMFEDTVERWYRRWDALQSMKMGDVLEGTIVSVAPVGVQVYIGYPYNSTASLHVSVLGGSERLTFAPPQTLKGETRTFCLMDQLPLVVTKCEFGQIEFRTQYS